MENINLNIYGTRGSVPCGSAEFMEFGGDTSSYALRIGNTLRLLDAGSGITRASRELTSDIHRAYLNFSHGHPDHLNPGCAGSMYFNNLEQGIFVTGNAGAKRSLEKFFDGKDFWPVPLSQLGGLNKTFLELGGGETIDYPDCEMKTLANYHPPLGLGGSIAYRFNIPTANGTVSVAYTTDMEFDFMPVNVPNPNAEELKRKYVNFIMGADVLLADTQFTKEEYDAERPIVRGFGHPNLEQVIDLANEAGVGLLLGTHHSPNHPDAMMRTIEKHGKDYAQGEGFRGDFTFARDGMSIPLGNTPQNGVEERLAA